MQTIPTTGNRKPEAARAFVVESRKPRGRKWKTRMTTACRITAGNCANAISRMERVSARVVERRPS